MIKQGKEYKYTEMQAIAYGLEMHSAKPAQGAMRMLKLLRDKGHRIILISHKTKYPIAGGCINLREKATQWLKKEGFWNEEKNSIIEDIIFTNTKEDKIRKINESGCELFVDDLTAVLDNIDESIQRILYSNSEHDNERRGTLIRIRHWNELEGIID